MLGHADTRAGRQAEAGRRARAGALAQRQGGCSRGWSALAAEHGVQKVDVIGDAYLAATNFLAEQTAPPFACSSLSV